MKQLTQAVFELPECPELAESAFVNDDGVAWYSDATDLVARPRLGTHVSAQPVDFWYIGHGYDTTDWQNSAINREYN